MKNKPWRLLLQLGIPLGIIGVVLYLQKKQPITQAYEGKKAYELHCANCHGQQGEGLKLLIPPLTDTNWLALPTLVCIIRYGIDKPIVVSGKSYQEAMPGNTLIENDQIAAVATYIWSTFHQKDTVFTLAQVNRALDTCNPDTLTTNELN